jgi:hypothetical protein
MTGGLDSVLLGYDVMSLIIGCQLSFGMSGTGDQ